MKSDLYKMPKRPRLVAVRKRDRFAGPSIDPVEIVTVDRFTECHVTPDDVAARMVEYLGPQGDYLTLEPSAGTGQLSKALLAAGHSRYELVQIERHHKLAGQLHRFGPVVNACFLEWTEENAGKVEFPRIIMNPPFRDVRKHMKAAESLLGSGGHEEPPVLVALVPVTFSHDRAETLETLGPDTFSTAKVHTKIIRITGTED